jgi:hypothetical protein
MKRILLAALLAAGAALPAFAEDAILKSGNNVIRLYAAPCANDKVMAEILPEWRDKFRGAAAILDGENWDACWIMTPALNEHLVFTDADEIELPARSFKSDGGI